MKTLPKILLHCTLVALLAGGAFGESAQQLLSEAQTAYLRGDMETAKRNFELANQLDPRNPTAIGYLRMIKAKEAQDARGGGGQEKQLAAVIIPKVEFREATFGSALDFLKQQVARQSQGKIAVNFVLQIPDEQVKTHTVTLSLTNVPFTEVLRYLGTLTGTTFAFEKYAIAVRPATVKTAAAAATAPEPARP
jgi:hypothetical protein